ncbi:unnamed protein product [Gordionus sp. m RMFG-2023]
MLEDDFLIFLNHFAKHAKPAKDRKVLIILDNHISHQSIKAIDFCLEEGIILLTLPPHCTHKLQPLDKTVFGPLKRYYNSSVDSWMRNNSGKHFTIYDIPGIVKEILPKACAPAIVQNGFKSCGIWPFIPIIFNDESYNTLVNDIPNTLNYEETIDNNNNFNIENNDSNDISLRIRQDESEIIHSYSNEPTTSKNFDPESIFPCPTFYKKSGKNKQYSAILTSSPYKKKAMERANKRKKSKNGINKKNNCLVCKKNYYKHHNNQDWFQCRKCGYWSHGSCCNFNPFFICKDCE